MMDQRLSLVTLGVGSVPASRAFYERLGWRASGASQGDEVVFFQLNGMGLALFGRAALATDAEVPDSRPGFSGVALAQNLASSEAVDRLFAEAVAAGAKPLKAPKAVFWGGYSGYFADPDGHVWEVAHNPFFSLDAFGNVTLPP